MACGSAWRPRRPRPCALPRATHLEHLELCDAGSAVVAVREPLRPEVGRRDGRGRVAEDAREAEAREVRREEAQELGALGRRKEARLAVDEEDERGRVILDDLRGERAGGRVGRMGTAATTPPAAPPTLTAVSSEKR